VPLRELHSGQLSRYAPRQCAVHFGSRRERRLSRADQGGSVAPGRPDERLLGGSDSALIANPLSCLPLSG